MKRPFLLRSRKVIKEEKNVKKKKSESLEYTLDDVMKNLVNDIDIEPGDGIIKTDLHEGGTYANNGNRTGGSLRKINSS